MCTFANRIKNLRKENNMTQSDLGKLLGVGNTTISMYESGSSTPNDEIKLKICEHFDISLDYLMGKSNIKKITTDDELKELIIQSDIDDTDLYKTLLSLKHKLTSNNKMFISGNELPAAHKDMLLSVVNLLLTQNNESK